MISSDIGGVGCLKLDGNIVIGAAHSSQTAHTTCKGNGLASWKTQIWIMCWNNSLKTSRNVYSDLTVLQLTTTFFHFYDQYQCCRATLTHLVYLKGMSTATNHRLLQDGTIDHMTISIPHQWQLIPRLVWAWVPNCMSLSLTIQIYKYNQLQSTVNW